MSANVFADVPIDAVNLFPSAIVCSCGERFDSDSSVDATLDSAISLYLAHKATAMGSSSSTTITKPHRVTCTFVSCALCAHSIGVDNYRAHLAVCGGERLAIAKYRQVPADRSMLPFFECDDCLDQDRFCRLDVGKMLEHRHARSNPPLGMELYVMCRLCSSGVAVDNALEHAAFAHRGPLSTTSNADVADLFFTTPQSTRSRWDSDADYLPTDYDETPVFAPDYLSRRSLGPHHQRPLSSDVQQAKQESSPVVESRATFDLNANDFLVREVFSQKLVDTLCQIGAEPTRARRPREIITGIMSSSAVTRPIVTSIRRTVALSRLPAPTVRKNSHECDECGQRFVNRKSLTFHQCKHADELLHQHVLHECGNCGRRCSTARQLQLHGQTHDLGESQSVQRSTFSRGDNTSRSSVPRTERVICKGERPFVCTDCGLRFIRSQELRRHGRVHTGEQPLVCTDCGKRFARSDNLRSHRRVHTGERPFVCTDCSKRFARSDRLLSHRRVHHRGTAERPFVCSDCGMRFIQSGNLSKHLLVHTSEFVCSDCGKRFSRSYSLYKHRLVHTGEQLFVCSDCGMRFNQSANLSRHRFVHTGERPFVCSDCGKGFTQSNSLIRHRRIHANERSFCWSDCGKTNNYPSALRRHRGSPQ